MSREAYLLFRRFGCLWALPAQHVTAIAPGSTPEIHLGHAAVAADEVVGVCHELHQVPAGRTLGAFWPYRCQGLGLFENQPTVVLSPDHVPPLLCKGEP
ncbi:hypothetical protein EG19_00135 [Thermoanaerobaculum aquaticum]|uniref:CheW-like domain-containing protein n=1 Tax=Thermoanaerobaculum aquaticum TaxID=1312852 RepID=A0A062Y046_9BACT|nr:hypothetical protein [Thermoanaerobaculum aquaticum]KDA55064.1 hypothetical protein EG19_00135 [Thermoanaerobaculum aquaticum]